MGALRVYVTGYITVPADRLDDVLRHLPEHIRLTKAEDGCCFFNCAQDQHDPCKITVDECFAGLDAFEAHKQRTADTVWAEVTKGMARSFEIEEDF